MEAARITVLSENTARGYGILAEHGLSFFIETPGARILFDTGQGLILARNARALNVDLTRMDAIVFSHGHYDHTGGGEAAIDACPAARVYLHPAALEPKYAPGAPVRASSTAHRRARSIGMPEPLASRLADHSRLTLVEDVVEVAEGVHLTGPVPRVTAFEDTGGEFYLDPTLTRTDELTDDQAAYIDVPDGVVVVLGCAHAGVVNTLRHIRRLTDDRRIVAVIGGMHLLGATGARLEQTVSAIEEIDPMSIYPVHCTGWDAASRLWSEFPGRVHGLPVTSVLEW